MEVNELKKLLDDFESIDVSTIPCDKTFMNISGYPHYENVCSNILGFFFLTDAAHGLNDLFIQALLKSMGEKVSHGLVVTEVLREQITSKGNRLDIVIVTDEYIIGIENKIYASLTNDLDDYSQYLNNVYKNKKLIKVLLSLYPIPKVGYGFTNISYDDYFDRIDESIGKYWHDANQKYWVYLDDFMKSIRKLSEGDAMDSNILNLVNNNLENTENFYSELNKLKRELRDRVQKLGNRIDYDKTKCKQWFWRENDKLADDLVHDITIGDAVIAVDTTDHPIGWDIEIWLRNPGSNQLSTKEECVEWLISNGLPKEDILIRANERSLFIGKYIETDNVADQLQEILNKLCK